MMCSVYDQIFLLLGTYFTTDTGHRKHTRIVIAPVFEIVEFCSNSLSICGERKKLLLLCTILFGVCLFSFTYFI
jgi:hypothetical protein